MNKNASEPNSLMTTKECAQQASCSTRHIQNLITRCKLSAKKDEGGNYLIERSEFYRVFPQAHAALTKRTEANQDDSSSRIVLEKEVEHLKAMLREKERQYEFVVKQLESSVTEKTMLIETLSSNQKLLEHTSEKKRKKFLGIF